MPPIRPAVISDGVSLSDKLRAPLGAFVPEHGAVDAVLPSSSTLVDTVIDELPPDKHRDKWMIRIVAKHNGLSRPDELRQTPAVSVSSRRVMPLVHRQTFDVAILCQPPIRNHRFTVVTPSERSGSAREVACCRKSTSPHAGPGRTSPPRS